MAQRLKTFCPRPETSKNIDAPSSLLPADEFSTSPLFNFQKCGNDFSFVRHFGLRIMDWRMLALGSAFFAGTTALLGKIGVQGIPSNLATLIRTTAIFPFLVAIVIARGEWSSVRSLTLHTVTFLTLSGIATGLSWMCYYRALQLGPASLISPIDKLSMIVAIGLSITFLGERLNAMQWLGVAMMLTGAFFVARK